MRQTGSIFDLQTMLRTVQRQSLLGRDGIFGPETQKAVAEFQRSQGLPVTGAADNRTWNTLVRAFEHHSIEQAQAEPLFLVLQPYQVIRLGEENSHLYLVQAMLLALGRYWADVPPLHVTGILDEETAQALRWFQHRAGLPVSGEVNRHTWRHLAKHYRSAVGDGTGNLPVRVAPSEPPGNRD